MTMFQRQKLKEYAEKMNSGADKGADSLLDKLKASKKTAWIIGGGLGATLVVLIMAFAL